MQPGVLLSAATVLIHLILRFPNSLKSNLFLKDTLRKKSSNMLTLRKKSSNARLEPHVCPQVSHLQCYSRLLGQRRIVVMMSHIARIRERPKSDFIATKYSRTVSVLEEV